VDPRTDVYALGVLIYRLLTGQYPFENGDALEVARMHLQSPPPRASQVAPVPPALDAVVLRAMEKQPESRFETPAALLAALRESITAPLECSRISLPALAVYVEARIDSEQMPSDATLDDLVTVLDIAETMLTGNRYRVPIETSTALLGITLLPAHTPTLPASGTELARHLYKRLERRSGASEAIHINICCHLDHAVVDFTAAEPVILGGPVLDVGTWAPRRDIHGPCATRSSMGEDGAGNSGSPHRLLDGAAG
jgi:serine/threonine-protein kinase